MFLSLASPPLTRLTSDDIRKMYSAAIQLSRGIVWIHAFHAGGRLRRRGKRGEQDKARAPDCAARYPNSKEIAFRKKAQNQACSHIFGRAYSPESCLGLGVFRTLRGDGVLRRASGTS
jgi:hypothetical protein